MTLTAIRDVRRQGGKPALVRVIVGTKPGWLADGATVVHVQPKANLSSFDWTPLMGVWVSLFSTDGDNARALQVADRLEQVGAKLFGAASPSGIHAMSLDAPESHHTLLRKEWESLCTT